MKDKWILCEINFIKISHDYHITGFLSQIFHRNFSKISPEFHTIFTKAGLYRALTRRWFDGAIEYLCGHYTVFICLEYDAGSASSLFLKWGGGYFGKNKK